ncbi:Protein of unknown function [Pyronema omphalodes CBS 100304]|uniref:Uncharacterized protein n=1 Tax=Pyronema omphalodes (strain CBS 100304) TaxID=1076935 RepID=U4LK42_PYROM|nr:Protein of unknown function [Pyronema omphalodes CBS 100304]
MSSQLAEFVFLIQR